MWIEQAASRPGVLACGVKAPQSTQIISRDPSFPESKIKELVQALADVAVAFRQDHLAGGRWRWLFENGQIHSARRPDGAMALLVVRSETVKPGVVDGLLSEFVSLEAI